jgi:hypothetical protein
VFCAAAVLDFSKIEVLGFRFQDWQFQLYCSIQIKMKHDKGITEKRARNDQNHLFLHEL